MVSEVSPSLSDSTDRPGEEAKAGAHRVTYYKVPACQDGRYHVEQRLAAILFWDFGELGAQGRGG